MEKGLVSIIIVTWNSRDTIERCLYSAVKAEYKPVEIILVDNASCDGTIEYVERNFPRVSIIRNNENMGFSYANNQGIRKSRGEFVFFLNPDAFIGSGFLSILVERMKADSSIGSAGGKIYKDTAERILDSTGIFFPPFKIGPYDRGGDEMDRGQFDRSRFIFGITGACALYRRMCLEDVRLGGEYFDERYFAYYEDVDLAWRAKVKGWKCLYEPKAIACHRRRGKAIKDTPLFSRAMANLYLTYIKNESGFGLIYLSLFKVPHEIMRMLSRIVFGGKRSYAPRILESLRLAKKGLAEAVKKRRLQNNSR